MTQEDHDDAMDAAAETMNARDMTIDINQETSNPVLEYPPASTTFRTRT
jgi:phospholipid N-methyltransferase